MLWCMSLLHLPSHLQLYFQIVNFKMWPKLIDEVGLPILVSAREVAQTLNTCVCMYVQGTTLSIIDAFLFCLSFPQPNQARVYEEPPLPPQLGAVAPPPTPHTMPPYLPRPTPPSMCRWGLRCMELRRLIVRPPWHVVLGHVNQTAAVSWLLPLLSTAPRAGPTAPLHTNARTYTPPIPIRCTTPPTIPSTH